MEFPFQASIYIVYTALKEVEVVVSHFANSLLQF